MTKNIEKARARPQAATGPYAPARMSTVKTELRVAGYRLTAIYIICISLTMQKSNPKEITRYKLSNP